MTERATKKAYKQHVQIVGNIMASKINQFRETFRKPDGTRYSYKESGKQVKAAFARAMQPEQ